MRSWGVPLKLGSIVPFGSIVAAASPVEFRGALDALAGAAILLVVVALIWIRIEGYVPDYWGWVVFVAFSLIFWFLLCVVAAQFGLSKESLGPKKILLVFLVACPIAAVILTLLLIVLGDALNYYEGTILPVVAWCLLVHAGGYLLWKGLTFSGGGVIAWWQWLVGHFR